MISFARLQHSDTLFCNSSLNQAMPWWDFRVALDSIENSYQFIHGTNAYADGCADVVSCLLQHVFKFALTTSLTI